MNPNPRSTIRWLVISRLLLGAAIAAALSGCAATNSTPEGPLFYPSPPQRPRIQFLTKFADAADVEGEASALMEFLVGEVGSLRRLRKPGGVAAYDGVIYVTDSGWDTVIAMDLKERSFASIGDQGSGKLRVPVAIAIDAEGNKFVADTGRKQVVQFDEQNQYVRAFGDPEKLNPSGVAVDEQFLYVSNRSEHTVEVLDRRSKQTVRTLGGFGTRDEQFSIPTSLSLDPEGHLFVTDMANFRIQEFDGEGNFVKSFGFLGDGPGTFARPKGTALDRDGHLYTVDAAFENVQIWDTSNAHALLFFGGPGNSPGDMYLPQDVYVSDELAEYFQDLVDGEFDLEYVILVTNNYGLNKVGVYGFVSPKDPSQYPEFPVPGDESEE